MGRSGCGWLPLGMTPMILLGLCLHLPGSASRCVPQAEEVDLEPLPAGVDPYLQPAGILQPQVRPQGPGAGTYPGVYGGIDSGSQGRPGPGSYGIDGPGAYGGTGSNAGPGPGSYGIDGPGAYGGTGTGSSGASGSGSSGMTGGTRCDTYEGATTGSYEQPGPGSYGIQGPGAYAGASSDTSMGGSSSQYGRPGAGFGSLGGHLRPAYKNPSIPFMPGVHDEARIAGHTRVSYGDTVSYVGNSGVQPPVGGLQRPKYKDPSIPYMPSLSELPNHAGQEVPPMPEVSINIIDGGGVGMGDVAAQGSSTQVLPNNP